jgi:flagellar basal body-associated protein FliL
MATILQIGYSKYLVRNDALRGRFKERSGMKAAFWIILGNLLFCAAVAALFIVWWVIS